MGLLSARRCLLRAREEKEAGTGQSRGPREKLFPSTVPCPERSGNYEEHSRNPSLVGPISNLLLPRAGWNPSTPNGPEAMSAIDRRAGCTPSPSRVTDETDAEAGVLADRWPFQAVVRMR